jgi:hypothetical protein
MASLTTVVWGSGSIQQFVFQPAMETGWRQGMLYLAELGPISLQDFSYDLVPAVAGIIEDGDGIAPSGSITCDRTPTVSWTGLSDGGPYVYLWIVSSGSVSGPAVVSGTVINTNLATVPILVPGDYRIDIYSFDSGGTSGHLSVLSFTVFDCTLPFVFLYDPLLDLDAFQIEPVVPQEEDYVRYLPQWMSVHGTATAPPSGSLLFRTLQTPIQQVRLVNRSVRTLLDEYTILQAPARLPRQAWHMQTRFTPRDTITVVALASGTTLPVRRSFSLYDFYTAADPAFLMGGTGHALFRNLVQRTVTVSPVSGSTGATGSVLEMLTHRYVLPYEGAGIVADTDVYFTADGVDYRMKAGSIGIDPIHATIQLPSLFTGDLTFRYQSKALESALTVSLSGNPFLTPSQIDLPNRFDELGTLAGLVRRRDEDNIAFRQRIYSRFITSLGVTAQAAAQHISQDLNQVMLLGWDGRTTLNLASSGIHGVRQVDVRGLSQWESHVEELIAVDSSAFSASKAQWRAGWFLTVDGVPVSSFRYPGLSVAGNIVEFGAAVSGRVVAAFQSDNYDLTYSDQGFVTAITPVSGNVLPGAYQVVLSQNCRIFCPSDPDYQAVYLLNADGTPNGFFNELRQRLLEGSPNHFTRARWGEGAFWLDQTDDLPPIDHLPTVFDQITGA